MKKIARAVLGAAALCAAASPSHAQTPAVGPRTGQFPDVIVSSVGGSYDTTTAPPSNASGIYSYGTSGGISAYAIGSDSCNLGSSVAIWMDTTTGFVNQHPVIGGQLYRLYQGRFEQIGMSWLKHGFCAADACSSNGFGTTGCANIKPSSVAGGNCSADLGTSAGNCDWLGYGRSTDTYGASLNGGQGFLGPRSEVNAWTGAFPYPYVRQGTNTASCLNKRLLVAKSELSPTAYPRYNASTNPSGAQFFSEVVYIVTDEWPAERMNNYSYRRVTAGTATVANTTNAAATCTGTGTELNWNLSYATGDRTVAQQPAIAAWKAFDPSVKLSTGDAPSDGRFFVGSKVTNLGNGTWQYEYAVFNMNSDRSGQSFSIGKAPSGVTVTNQAFQAPAYHSGEPYASTPWTMSVGSNSIDWSTQTYADNVNANALRWSTLYNFRFVANVAPITGSVRIGLFKPAVNSGEANFVDVAGVDVPGAPPCRPDYNGVNGVDLLDIFAFLADWFNGCTGTGSPLASCTKSADYNGLNGVDLLDIFGFLADWFAGCP